MSLKFTVVARKNLSKGAPEDSKLFYAQARFAVDRDVGTSPANYRQGLSQMTLNAKCLASTTERIVKETEPGHKEVAFEYVRFRRYHVN